MLEHTATTRQADSHHPLTIAQAAEWLQVAPNTVRNMIANGELKAYRYSARVIRIDRADLLKLRSPVTSTASYREQCNSLISAGDKA